MRTVLPEPAPSTEWSRPDVSHLESGMRVLTSLLTLERLANTDEVCARLREVAMDDVNSQAVRDGAEAALWWMYRAQDYAKGHPGRTAAGSRS